MKQILLNASQREEVRLAGYRKQKFSRIRHRLTNEKYQVKYLQRDNI